MTTLADSLSEHGSRTATAAKLPEALRLGGLSPTGARLLAVQDGDTSSSVRRRKAWRSLPRSKTAASRLWAVRVRSGPARAATAARTPSASEQASRPTRLCPLPPSETTPTSFVESH